MEMVSAEGRSCESNVSESCRIYIIEGLITIVFGIVCFWLVPKSFEQAYVSFPFV